MGIVGRSQDSAISQMTWGLLEGSGIGCSKGRVGAGCSVSSFNGLTSSTIVKSMEIYYCTRKKVLAYSLLVMLLLNNIKFLQQLLELHCLLGASYNDEGIQ